MISEALIANQTNLITFVLVDNAYNEVAGVGNAFTLEISKAGGAFVASTGVKAEISDGWYSYELTAAECDTIGPLSVMIPANIVFSYIQQNLLFVVETYTPGAVEYTYTITNTSTGLPIEDVFVKFTTDAAGLNTAWIGQTDVFGVARDVEGSLPLLDPGTYYIWRNKIGFTFVDPDVELVSP